MEEWHRDKGAAQDGQCRGKALDDVVGILHDGRNQQPAAAVEQHYRPDHAVEALQHAEFAQLLLVLVGEGVNSRLRCNLGLWVQLRLMGATN